MSDFTQGLKVRFSRSASLLQRVGSVVHQAKSGRLIVKLQTKAEPGSSVFDSKEKKLGRVVELIGPVASPYASIAISTSRVGNKGDPVFGNG